MKLNFLAIILTASLVASAPLSPQFTTDNEKRNTNLNTLLSIILEHLPNVHGAIEGVEKTITAFNNVLSVLTGVSSTYNELGGACTAYTVIFSRGTCDNGNTGVLTGPPFFMALKELVGSSYVTIQGVNNYTASVENYLAGGDPVGSASMASTINSAYAACPKTHLTVAGYSQGGQVLHNALGLLAPETAKWISSVVIFGDPHSGKVIPNVDASKVDTVCHKDDDVCVNGDIILPTHLTYARDAQAAAAFVVAAAKASKA
ncbi:hypothetical protein DSL72_007543 [Monilinia vaccinii-corymbosi]|uniref:cutinase n=1 Tax=Monilinia vaccinii-corymbosi TaxID=61207 RepID=A0A8A3PHG8_9HELO|nr:hypothetical protein DSL72_007543 [Monilinia vaccinii-corymbosi]